MYHSQSDERRENSPPRHIVASIGCPTTLSAVSRSVRDPHPSVARSAVGRCFGRKTESASDRIRRFSFREKLRALNHLQHVDWAMACVWNTLQCKTTTWCVMRLGHQQNGRPCDGRQHVQNDRTPHLKPNNVHIWMPYIPGTRSNSVESPLNALIPFSTWLKWGLHSSSAQLTLRLGHKQLHSISLLSIQSLSVKLQQHFNTALPTIYGASANWVAVNGSQLPSLPKVPKEAIEGTILTWNLQQEPSNLREKSQLSQAKCKLHKGGMCSTNSSAKKRGSLLISHWARVGHRPPQPRPVPGSAWHPDQCEGWRLDAQG